MDRLLDIEIETSENRAWHLGNDCSYTPIGFLDSTKTHFDQNPEAVYARAQKLNFDFDRFPLTAKIVYSPIDGFDGYEKYTLRALKGYNKKQALKKINRHGVYNLHFLLNQKTLADTPNKKTSDFPWIATSPGPVIPTPGWIVYDTDAMMMAYAQDILRGHTRVGFPTMANWIVQMYRSNFSVYGKNQSLPVHDGHFMLLQVERFMDGVNPKEVTYGFPTSTRDALRFLAGQPPSPYTPVITNIAKGMTRQDYFAQRLAHKPLP